MMYQRLVRQLPPGYIGYPIIRDVQFLLTLNREGGLMIALNASRQRYGSFFTAPFIGGSVNITCGGQDDLVWLFNNDAKFATDTAWPPNISALLGPGAVANQVGSYHRALRRLLEPSFAPKFVNNYLTVMDTTTLEELEDWCATGNYVSSNVFKMYALKLFYKSAFGRTDDIVLAKLHDDFKLWLDGFLSLTGARRIPGSVIDTAMKARERILDTVNTLIDEFSRENPEDSERAKTTIIGRLIYGKDKDDSRMLTRDEIKDNLLNLIFAGHDTTFASISTLLYHLCQNPVAMEALVKEVSTLSTPLQSDELKAAPVLNACIHESWRLVPPVFGSFRRAAKVVEHKGYTFKPGTTFNYSILMTTTDESLYPNHDKFDMRRFLPKDHPLYAGEIDTGVDPFAGRTNYPIFGGGTHVCLGKAFAQLELRVFAARLARHYKVEIRNPKRTYLPVNVWDVEFKLTQRKKE
jgi:cytochrome P450